MNRTAARRTAYAASALWTVCAFFAALTAAVTSLPPHRVWGVLAACGYAALALASLAAARRPAPRASSVTETTRRAAPPPRGPTVLLTSRFLLLGCGLAVVAPLLVLVFTGSAQEEVHVVHRAGARLLTHGTPYLGPDQLAGADYSAYNPYLPGMALFGVPQQLLGLDARFGFAAVFLGTVAFSLRIAGGHAPETGRSSRRGPVSRWPAGRFRGLRNSVAGPTGGGAVGVRSAGARTVATRLRARAPRLGSTGRRTLILTASPLVALPMAVGGDDLPVLGLVCLGLALAGRPGSGAAGRAGLVLGAACTLKATAWPALPVVAALLAVRAGRPAVLRLLGGAAPALVAGVLLPALVDGPGLMANAVRFPLGLAEAPSPAAAPLPGRLLATLGPAGHLCAVAALVLAALLIGGSLLVRPPRDASGAALRLALGLLAAMALLPASRFGYAVYPAVLALWAHWRTLDVRRTEPAPVRHRPSAATAYAAVGTPDTTQVRDTGALLASRAGSVGGNGHRRPGQEPPREPAPEPEREPWQEPGAGPHADRDERLSPAPGRHRDVRPRGRTPVSTR
ncbi:hypothetical protein ACTWQF_20395 [Streptomyces sp. 8N114]|uniref:hypothetical protein n=1 Tax=Streptomyces sp. 8N114 TaxID=3457419 RepID=UPI003FD4D02D